MFTNEYGKNLPKFLQEIKENTKYKVGDRNQSLNLFLQENDVRIDPDGSNICQFLKHKSILVTGGTGFLGKLLIEKLLRACIDIEKIYLLVRDKKNKDGIARVQEIFNDKSPVFEKLKDIHPDYQTKLHAINGELGCENLGLKESDRQILIDKVDLIYHVAATTKFNEHIRKAVAINIKGTMQVIDLAKQCKHLKSMVYVGTAYSNCNEPHIEEKFYEPRLPPEQIIAITENFSDEELTMMTPGLLGYMPNTYTFTKQIAENIVKSEAHNLPICLFRPAIVMSTVKEPIRNWNDNIFGPVGMMVVVGVGLVRVMPGNQAGKADVVPVDYVINACIACSYEIANDKTSTVPKVFNYATSKKNTITWGTFTSILVQYTIYIGTTFFVWYPSIQFVKSTLIFQIMQLVYHKLLGYCTDSLLLISGKKPQMMDAYRRVDEFIGALSYFTLNEWIIDTDNINQVWRNLNSHDQKMFPFDMENLNWQRYLSTTSIACRVYILKESLHNLSSGRKKGKIFFYVQSVIKAVFYSLLLIAIYKLTMFLLGKVFW